MNAFDSKISELRKYAQENYVPIIQDDSLEVLLKLLRDRTPKKILEIGTAIGFSASFIAKELPNSDILTVEIDETRYNIANKTFSDLGISGQIKSLLVDAKACLHFLTCDPNYSYQDQELRYLNDNIKHLQNQKFDFIFLDGPKGQYLSYLPLLKQLLSDNGVIFCDNIYFKNLVFETGIAPKKVRTIVVNLKKFIDILKSDDEIIVNFYNNGDGLAIIEKRK